MSRDSSYQRFLKINKTRVTTLTLKRSRTKDTLTYWLGFLGLIVALAICSVNWAQCAASLNCATCNINSSGTITYSQPEPPAGCSTNGSQNCPGIECCMMCQNFNRCNPGCCTAGTGSPSPNFNCYFAPAFDAAWSAFAPETIKASNFSTGSKSTDQAIASPEIRIELSGDLPLQLSNVTPVLSKNGNLEAIAYEITNQGPSSLVAWRVIWAVNVGGGSKPIAVFGQETDTWYGDESDHISVGASTSDRECVSGSAAPVSLMRGSVDYAEYSDGTRVGSAASKEFAQLQERRKTRLRVYNDSLRIYATQGEQGLAAWLAEAATTVYQGQRELQSEVRAARAFFLASGANQYLEKVRFVVDKAARQKMVP